ncbi:6920_t:CDS:2 [Entrophospora sp. SA101]|nr:6920_t:CDS:2 [Entrophospora sp. SA101]CAJ0834996.1 4771_t:CDS:2 [Entrophospora sp. SA101]CAJ0849253.1 10904_t:CDS:2 [Entrophospora sp. SA101]
MEDLYAQFKASPQYTKATDILKYSTTVFSSSFLAKGLDFQTIVANATTYDQLYHLETSLPTYSSLELQDAITDGGNYVGRAIEPQT